MPFSRVQSLRVLAGFAIAATLLTGCGSDDTEPAATSTTKTTATVTTTAAPRSTVTIDVDDMKFSPDTVTVRVGDTVTWKFDDKVPHSVQGIGDKAMGINSPIFDQGEWSYTFTAAGTYRYLCSLHPEMRGSVTVN
ncbi:cupredoxin family copper-binding protein [Nocardia sp. NPDC127579]|uniref:cupredoxin domain-containing protein n=1 Tax=Nocardia sp. NPDC127579 TaxID=3345402 RepID=UPI0036272D58